MSDPADNNDSACAFTQYAQSVDRSVHQINVSVTEEKNRQYLYIYILGYGIVVYCCVYCYCTNNDHHFITNYWYSQSKYISFILLFN